ncbi:PQQ-dependent sugar dehydrogenase [Tundrisphaera sp. TA3]|uniref:PQQ-dependent sugar dehydrogenase n=1 Tax=Tundrisphaera sp. TA3 TaxID=3435775 RepID=UPI003EBF957D
MPLPSNPSPRIARGIKPASIALVAAALCGTAEPPPEPAIPTKPAYGLERREAIGAYLDRRLPTTPPASAGGWEAVPAFPNLTFQDPVFVTQAPGGFRLYVCGRQGIIESFENMPTVSTKATFLDIRGRCQGWDDSGLLGLAFHPEFGRPDSPNRGYFYVAYNYTDRPTPGPDRPDTETPTCNRLSRFTVPDGAEAADPDSELVLIDQRNDTLWHNGGGLFFHPEDGFLYLSIGDEGHDTGNTQKIDRDLFSGVIRIDVDCRGEGISHPPPKQPRTGTTAHYFIPDDNPWVGVPDALEEFWCIGLRSPHRMTYDPVGRRIWLGDVGEGAREEINLIERGGNYQWRFKEGTVDGRPARPAEVIGREIPPIHEYSHADGNAVIGGYAYRGREHSRSLRGKYIFGDVNGCVWALTEKPGARPSVVLLCTLPTIPSNSYGTGLSSFGEDADGELLLCQMGDHGQIFKLARADPAGMALPAMLSATGAFRDLRTLDPAPGLIPYDVNAPLWSDGAAKKRWIAVPNAGAPYGEGERIGFSASGEWTFPVGTVFVKHFELDTDETADGPPRRLETRLMVLAEGGMAYGATYRWNDAQDDAERLDDDRTETFTIRTAEGPREQSWYYPNPRDCMTCHNPQAGYVLGVKTRQLNGPMAYAGTGREDNQIRAWNRVGLFHPELAEADIPRLPRLVPIGRADAPLEDRVRSYLDANCAHCHRPNGVRARFDARFDTAMAEQGLVDGEIAHAFGLGDVRVVMARDPARSVLHRRMESRDPSLQMPPLARNVPDAKALAVIREWIESLPGPGGPAVVPAGPSE